MKEKPSKHRFDRDGYCDNPNRNTIYRDALRVESLTILTAFHAESNTWHCGYEFRYGTFLTSHLVRRTHYSGHQTELEAKIKAFALIRAELAIKGMAFDYITDKCLKEAKYAERDAINRFVLLKQQA